MPNNRIIDDAARLMAGRMVQTVMHLLREEELKDAFEEFFVICRAGIEAFEIENKRMLIRMHPTNN
jgi:hypothetical protein